MTFVKKKTFCDVYYATFLEMSWYTPKKRCLYICVVKFCAICTKYRDVSVQTTQFDIYHDVFIKRHTKKSLKVTFVVVR